MVDDSGVYSALPGTPPPWNDYDDDQPATRTDAATVTLSEFPRERLKFVEKLGEGLFGEVNTSLDEYFDMYLRIELRTASSCIVTGSRSMVLLSGGLSQLT